MNAFYLVLFIALFLLAYLILLPEDEKERLGGQDGTRPISDGTRYGSGGQQVLFSQSVGSLQPFGQKIYARPLASVSLQTTVDKEEELLSRSLDVTGGFFSGAEKDLVFRVTPDTPVESVKLVFFLEAAAGSITISLNGREIFSGPLTAASIPLLLPVSSLRAVNHLTFSTQPGFFSKNKYVLRDVTLFKTYRVSHTREQRTFVLNKEDLQRFRHLSLFYIVNCFTVQEKGTLQIRLNEKLISQQQIVCDAGEVSHDLARNDLREGRNALEFSIDQGNYVLERMLLEGDIDAGKAPGYFFTAPVGSLGRTGHVALDMQLTADNRRKVATVFVNGYPLYLDTYDDRFSFDITPYVVPGQNNLRIVAETSFDVASLDILLV